MQHSIDWYPIENLIGIEIGTESEELTINDQHASTRFKQPIHHYIAICAETDWSRRTTLFRIALPETVIAEMTNAEGVVYIIDTHDANPWQAVADRINAAALRWLQKVNHNAPKSS